MLYSVIHELCSELIFTTINYACRNMLLSTVSKSNQVSVPTSKVSKSSMLCLLVGIFLFLLYPAMKSKALHSVIHFWFIPGSPEMLSVELDRHRGCQVTAISLLWEWDSADHSYTKYKGLWKTHCTESRAGQGGPSQHPGCPDHAKICQMR